jgi:hypothetical protein
VLVRDGMDLKFLISKKNVCETYGQRIRAMRRPTRKVVDFSRSTTLELKYIIFKIDTILLFYCTSSKYL